MEMFPASFKPSCFFVWNQSKTGIRGQKSMGPGQNGKNEKSRTGQETKNFDDPDKQNFETILDQVGPILVRFSPSFVIA